MTIVLGDFSIFTFKLHWPVTVLFSSTSSWTSRAPPDVHDESLFSPSHCQWLMVSVLGPGLQLEYSRFGVQVWAWRLGPPYWINPNPCSLLKPAQLEQLIPLAILTLRVWSWLADHYLCVFLFLLFTLTSSLQVTTSKNASLLLDSMLWCTGLLWWYHCSSPKVHSSYGCWKHLEKLDWYCWETKLCASASKGIARFPEPKHFKDKQTTNVLKLKDGG